MWVFLSHFLHKPSWVLFWRFLFKFRLISFIWVRAMWVFLSHVSYQASWVLFLEVPFQI
jgi:hypothetical protein